MYIDYVALMLINLVAGLVLLACWVFLDMSRKGVQQRWVPGLLMSGFISLVTGLHMIFNWPLPGALNLIYGEMAVFFGILLLGLSIVLWFELDLLPLGVYAAFAGLASVLVGIQVLKLGLTQYPALSGLGFIWMGLVGLFAIPMLRVRDIPAFRILGTVGLVIAAVLWGIAGYAAYWDHLTPHGQWKPTPLSQPMETHQRPACS